jgi:hypothetical protein
MTRCFRSLNISKKIQYNIMIYSHLEHLKTENQKAQKIFDQWKK